jgi:hypothetical protein
MRKGQVPGAGLYLYARMQSQAIERAGSAVILFLRRNQSQIGHIEGMSYLKSYRLFLIE